MKTIKNVAGIQFTDLGICIERAYSEDASCFANRKLDEKLFTGKFVQIAKYLAKNRMAHCYNELHRNLAKATHVTSCQIAWSDGHFSVPVWEALENILSIEDVRDLDFLQTQQLIRSMLIHGKGWIKDRDDNFREIGDSIYVSDEFVMFITEHMMVVER